MWSMTACNWLSSNASANAGITSLKPRTGPPALETMIQSASGSREAKLQSVRSGNGSSNAIRPGGAPWPSDPWQLAHPAS